MTKETDERVHFTEVKGLKESARFIASTKLMHDTPRNGLLQCILQLDMTRDIDNQSVTIRRVKRVLMP